MEQNRKNRNATFREAGDFSIACLDVFYTSTVCNRLHDPETELYTFSDAYIVDEIIMEIRNN